LWRPRAGNRRNKTPQDIDVAREAAPAVPHAFIVHHSYETPDGREHVKLIGAFSSKADAELAIKALRDEPGFKEMPDGFTVELYELNKVHWPKGFVL